MGLYDFTWPVHVAGYTWLPPEPGSNHPAEYTDYHGLVPVDPAGPVRWYQPLRKNTALFRSFAEVELTHQQEGRVVEFANKFGLLGDPPAGYDFSIPDLSLPEDVKSWNVLLWWRCAIHAMRDMIGLWDAVRTRDHSRLQNYITWWNDHKVVYHNNQDPRFVSPLQIIASREVREGWLAHFKQGDLVTPAWFHLMSTVNMWLAGLVNAELQWDEAALRPVAQIVPSSLLGALWLQLYHAIDGEKNYRTCEVCKTWFEVTPKVNRTTKRYCSDACRSQALQDRHKRAQQMHEEGQSLKEIASKLGSDVPTVKKWVKGKKE
jgi:hypothetical protein